MSYRVLTATVCILLFCVVANVLKHTQSVAQAPPPRAFGSTSASLHTNAQPAYQLPGLPPITGSTSSPTQDLANRLRRQANEERSEEDLKKLRELVVTEFTERQTVQKEEAESILAKAQEALDILEKRDEKQEEPRIEKEDIATQLRSKALMVSKRRKSSLFISK